MPDLTELSDEDLLTACLWAEARGESEEGQRAVCAVILNRVKKKMAPDIRAVILKPKQFSWTDAQDVNYGKVFTAKTDSPESRERAHKIAQTALADALEDITRAADHKGKVTVVIGHHTFLNLSG